MFSKVQRKKAYVENEEGYFSYFELEGADKSEPLIFFHATGLNAETYLNLLEKLHSKLDRKKTIIAFDQRGHGITNLQADPKKLTSWDQYADDAEIFLEKINISSAIFFGHSMGSIVAAEVAKRNKFKISNLIMLDPVLFYDPYTSLFSELKNKFITLRSNTKVLGAAKRRDKFDSFSQAMSHYEGRSMFKTWPSISLEHYLSGGLEEEGPILKLSCNPVWEAKTFETVSFKTYRTLNALNLPILILRAKHFSTFSSKGVNYLNKKQNFSVSEVEGSHFFPIENTEDTKNLIQKFISSHHV